jgi:hypothetical protein
MARTLVNPLEGGREMKSRSEIWLSVLEDLGDLCSVSTRADAETMRRRVESEGDSFFTITLPLYGKQLERALAGERLPHDGFVGWKRQRMVVDVLVDRTSDVTSTVMAPWGVPLFLGGFMEQIFEEPRWTMHQSEVTNHLGGPSVDLPMRDASSEVIAAEMATAVYAVRQLTLLFSKEKALAPAKAQRRAIRQYIEVDQELDRPL